MVKIDKSIQKPVSSTTNSSLLFLAGEMEVTERSSFGVLGV